MKNVAIIDRPTQAEFSDTYVATTTPVLIKNGTSEWKAHELWNADYLSAKIGHCRRVIRRSPTSIHPDYFSGLETEYFETSIADLLQVILSEAPDRAHTYLSGDSCVLERRTTQTPDLRCLCEDYIHPNLFPPERFTSAGFWMSAFGVFTATHYDGDGGHNLNVQVRGQKRVRLFSPNASLEPFNPFSPDGELTFAPQNFSSVSPVSHDSRDLKVWEDANGYEVTMCEGDMLFIPSYWFHSVLHEGEFNVNVNFWWTPEQIVQSKTSLRANIIRIIFEDALKERPATNRDEIRAAWAELPIAVRRFARNMVENVSQ